MMKHYFLTTLLCCAMAHTAMATDNGEVNVLYLDGSSHIVKMTQIEKIEVEGDQVNVVTKDGATKHLISNINRIELGNGYTDIKQLKAKQANITVRSNGYVISAEGMDDGTTLEVYAQDGKLMGKTIAKDGKATINAQAMNNGMYIVKAGSYSLKMVKK